MLGQSTEILQTSENPFATVILTVLIALQKKKAKRKKDTDTDELFALKIDLAKRLLAHSFPKPKVRALTNFLRFYVCFDKHEISAKFDNKITVLQNEKTMGIEEFLLYRAEQQGIEESIGQGIEQQKYESVKNMLLRTTFPPEQIADILDVSVECVLQVKQEMQ